MAQEEKEPFFDTDYQPAKPAGPREEVKEGRKVSFTTPQLSRPMIIAIIGGLGLLFVLIGAYVTTRDDSSDKTETPSRSAATAPATNKGTEIRLEGTYDGWRAVGSGSLTLESSGKITLGTVTTSDGSEQAVSVGPDGWKQGDGSAKVPSLQYGVLMVKIGEGGKPFKAGSYREVEAGDRTVFVAINDSDYTDNSGAFIIKVRETAAKNVSSSSTARPACVVSYPSGSCWTIQPPQYQKATPLSSDSEYRAPSVEVNGRSCTVIVPAASETGVVAEGFNLNAGEEFEITVEGTVMFSPDHPRVGPEGMRGWYDPHVDSPFKENVGGLEFSIGTLRDNRYQVGKSYTARAEHSGSPVFRVIERREGYGDGNSGRFKVTIRKR